MFLQFWHLWKTQRRFWVFNALWVCFGYMEVLGFDFGIRVSEIWLFCVRHWCDFLWYNFFSGLVWLLQSSWCVPCRSIHQVYWVSDRCRSDFALWWFFVGKHCRHSTGSFSFWSWLPDIPWFFINFKDSVAFLGLIMHCLLIVDTWACLVVDFRFLSVDQCHFVSISHAVFLVTNFSIFDHSVWLILSFWCPLFYSYIQFYRGSSRCTNEFALDCFCLKKVITNW